MKEHIYEIWCEGDPNLDFTATHLGIGKGTNFLEACRDLASKNSYFARHLDYSLGKDSLMYKNCRLFSSETQARLSHG